MKVNHLNLCVQDLDVSWAFYSRVLGAEYCYNLAANKIVASLHGFELFLEEVPNCVAPPPQFHFGIITTRDDVSAWFRRIRDNQIPIVKGNNPTADIYEDPESARVAFYFLDPNGIMIEIYSPD